MENRVHVDCIEMDIICKEEFRNAVVPISEAEKLILEDILWENKGLDTRVGKIILWQPDKDKPEAYIIDGFSRWDLCEKNGYTLESDWFAFMDFDSEEQVIEWIEDNNLGRRNLSKYARFEIIYRKHGEDLKELAKKNMADGGKGYANVADPCRVNRKLAELVGVSERTIGDFKRIYDHYQDAVEDDSVTSEMDEIMAKLRTGEISANDAKKRLFAKDKDPEKTGNVDGSDATPTKKERDKDRLIREVRELNTKLTEVNAENKRLREENEELRREIKDLEDYNADLLRKLEENGLKVADNDNDNNDDDDENKIITMERAG